jgi:cold shock CspA family protein
MQMRFEGVLSQWDDARGIGFITPNAGGEAVFAHVSAFPRMAQRPTIGLRLSFEVEIRPDGRKRARQIRLSATGNTQPGPRYQAPQHNKSRRIPVLFLLIGMTLAWAYQRYAANAPASSGNAVIPVRAAVLPQLTQDTSVPEPTAQAYGCDGRTHCSQMRSCSEATFFLQHCPTVQMDGDNDGIPCEQQWCNSLAGNGGKALP